MTRSMSAPPALTLIAGLAAAACGATSQDTTVAQPTRVMDGVAVVEDGPGSMVAIVDADPDLALRAAAAAYEALGIEIRHLDSRARVVGNRQLTVSRRLGGERLSTYFDCGLTMTGAPSADSYRIQADITTAITPGDDGARVETRITATGRDLGTSAEPVRCASRGTLEQRILHHIAEHLP